MNAFNFGKLLFTYLPFLRPLLIKGKMSFAPSYWGMSTLYARPDLSITDKIFRDSVKDVHGFDKKNPKSYNKETIDGSLWRFWYVAFATQQAKLFAKSDNFVECGVMNGYTAYFSMKQLSKNFTMHLYDAWEGMQAEYLTESEKSRIGEYKELDIDVTKLNLKEFKKNTIYHKGHIPKTLDETAPDNIAYLHIDLNSSKATKDTLDFFLPRLVENGIILFDDYGYPEYFDTANVIDQSLDGISGNILKLPTAQAIFFKS